MEYRNVTPYINRHVDDEDKDRWQITTPGGLIRRAFLRNLIIMPPQHEKRACLNALNPFNIVSLLKIKMRYRALQGLCSALPYFSPSFPAGALSSFSNTAARAFSVS